MTVTTAPLALDTRSGLDQPDLMAPEPDPEAELLARIRAGDERAREILVRRYDGRMRAIARRFLGCEEDSADAVQDAFLSAFRAMDSFAGNARLGTWLHRIVVNTCLMRLRSRSRRRTTSWTDLPPQWTASSRLAGPVDTAAESPMARLARAETRSQVRAAIDRLPEPYRKVLVLRDIEGFDTDQTARALGISGALVKTRLHRARQALRAVLEPIFGREDHAVVGRRGHSRFPG